MRIISQNGIADIPYDLYGVRQLKSDLTKIIAFTNGDEFLIMAEYSTEAKAKKAMEMLQNDYYDHVAEKTYHKGSYYIHPYFRFPKDEDVED